MSEEDLDRELLSKLSMDRRAFIKKVVVGAAFAAPVVASFDMFAFSSAYGKTNSTGGNGSSGGGTGVTGGTGTTGGTCGTGGGTGGTGGTGCTGGTGGTGGGTGGGAGGLPSDRALKTDITPVSWD